MLDLLGSVEAARLPGGELVVSAHGPIDGRIVTSFVDVLVGATTDADSVVLDLTDAHGLDDTALAVVEVAAQLLAERGARLRVVARPLLTGELRASSLAETIDLHASLREAIAVD
ncbi:MAG TPA: STAS domain-containing protein [Gaiellaceae bacterium]|nr:STAS domain-containing protein [Gaiellaceae bacterium]